MLEFDQHILDSEWLLFLKTWYHQYVFWYNRGFPGENPKISVERVSDFTWTFRTGQVEGDGVFFPEKSKTVKSQIRLKKLGFSQVGSLPQQQNTTCSGSSNLGDPPQTKHCPPGCTSSWVPKIGPPGNDLPRTFLFGNSRGLGLFDGISEALENSSNRFFSQVGFVVESCFFYISKDMKHIIGI